MPKVRDVLALTSGKLSWWIWLTLLLLTTVLALLEREMRRSSWNGAGPKRIPLIDTRQIAAEAGWEIAKSKTTHDVLDLLQGLTQAAHDGEVNFWGRENKFPGHPDLNMNGVLTKIPTSHWKSYKIAWSEYIYADSNMSNMSISDTYTIDDCGRFVDLHIEREPISELATLNRAYVQRHNGEQKVNALERRCESARS